MADEKQFALLRILETLSRTSAKALVYTTAVLGILALSPTTQLPPELLAIASGLGVEAIGSILDKVASNHKISDEEITALVKQVVSDSNLGNLLTKDEFWQGFARLRKSQEKIGEQNEIIIAQLQQLESPSIKDTKLLLVDFSVLNEDYHTEELPETGRIPIAFPTFSLQEIYDRTHSTEEVFPVVFDIKLVNKGETTAFLKEVRFEILDAIIDASPVVSYFPTTTQSGNNLLLALTNYGWGIVKVKEFAPFSNEIDLFKEVYDEFLWRGEYAHNAYFIFPHTLIGQKIKNFLSYEEGKEIEDLSNSIRSSSLGFMSLSGPNISDRESKLRDRYLKDAKGIAYQDFTGKMVYMLFDQEIDKALRWGRYRPGVYCDLVFSEAGFHLMEMYGVAKYIPPSHNYNMALSYSDKGKTKRIKVSQEISSNSVERFTITTTASESCIYKLKMDLLYDASGIISSQEMFVHFLAFRQNDGESYETYVFENGWKKIN